MSGSRLTKNAVMPLNARATERQFRKNINRPEVTIMGTPVHKLQREILPNDAAGITPASSMRGARMQ